MSQLGSYITNEYAVLLQIFSYLPSKSLANAAQVCREWQEVARRVLMKRNKPSSNCKIVSYSWKPFNDKIQPKVILHFQSIYGNKCLGADFLPMMSRIYDMEDVPVYNIRNNYFIASEYVDNKLEINSKLGKNSEAALILCDMPGVTVNSSYITLEDLGPEESDLMEDLLRPDTKCFILISSGEDDTFVFINRLLLTLYVRRKTVLMAGGIAQKVLKDDELGKRHDHSYMFISFHGDNVEANVGVHELNENLEEFLENLSKTTGPLPNGAIRFAFMFTCINRLHMLHDIETKTFSKYFPNVPVYGFWSYGEFIASFNGKDEKLERPPHSGHEDCKDYTSFFGRKSLMGESEWMRSECTSYLILTLRRTV